MAGMDDTEIQNWRQRCEHAGVAYRDAQEAYRDKADALQRLLLQLNDEGIPVAQLATACGMNRSNVQRVIIRQASMAE